MTEERDPKVSKRYRGLGREEPSRDLDERILAASRRAGRGGRYRWAGPLAAAAVLVLAVGIALQVEREEPKEMVAKVEAPKPAPPAPPPAAPVFTPDPRPQEPSREMRARPERRAAPAQAPAPQAAPASADNARQATDSASAAAEGAARRDAQVEARSEAAPRARAELAKAQQSPEQWLERIAQLRREGKGEEADRQLAEFRRAYPDYRLTEEMKAKVERPAPVPAR